METIRNLGRRTHDFGRSVVEWRSPVSGPYLMAVNSLFWALAVYGDSQLQSRVLVSLAAGVVGWDVLLSPSRDRSTLMHLFAWPLASFWRTAGVLLSFFAVHQIKAIDETKACIAAYSALGCLLVNPVWQHHRTTQKIVGVLNVCWTKIKETIDFLIVQPSIKIFYAVKYVVLLEFVPPLLSWIGSKLAALRDSIYAKCRAMRDWWRGWVMLPMKEKFYSFGRFLRYWLCAGWWPAVKERIVRAYQATKERCVHGFNYVCYGVVYVVCGYWVRPVGRYLGEKLKLLGAYLHRNVWTPVKSWLLWQLRCSVEVAKKAAKAIAIAVRDSVLWPIGILIIDALYQLSAVFYRTALQPVLHALYLRYRVLEDYVFIYFLGPACKTFIDSIPEKNPLCDDSDVELEGFLPEEISEEIEKASEPDPDSALEDDFLPPDSPLDLEESEFTTGLSFPAVYASESSDEEFDLRGGNGDRKQDQSRPKAYQRRRTERRQDEGPEKPPPDGERQTTRSSQRENPDESFELLQ